MTKRVQARARIGIGVALAALAATTLNAAPAGAATVAATGATITRTDAAAGTTLTVKATVARLDLWCSSNKLVVNKRATTIPCDRLLSVTTTGLIGNDTVEINATGFGSALPKTTLAVKTGAGNDTINVRHNGSLTVYGGAGNDKIGAGLATGKHPVSETLLGEDGNDTLSNYGFITATRVWYNSDAPAIAASKALGSTLRGGPGTDTIIGDDYRWSTVPFDAADRFDLKEGPALLSPDEGTGVVPSFTYQVASGDPSSPDTLAYGRSTALTVRCVTVSGQYRAKYVVNGVRLPVDCAFRYLAITGTDRAESLDYDQALGNGSSRYGLGIQVNMGGGNDTATLRHPMGSSTVDGGTGDDRLASGIHNGLANGESSSNALLRGGPGNDTVTNLGFLDPNPPVKVPGEPDYAFDHATYLQGDAGADRLVGGTTRVDDFTVDVHDTVIDNGGPAVFRFQGTSGADRVAIHHRGAAASTLDVTAGGVSRSFPLTPLTSTLVATTFGGDDVLSVDGASVGTLTVLEPGTGTDQVSVAPGKPATSDVPGGYTWIRIPGYQSIGYDAEATERFTLVPSP
jgi:hypothetical protein